MTVGFILLCHVALDRAAEVARHLAQSGACVAIHLDARVPKAQADVFRIALEDLPSVRFCRQHPCEWGTWGLVAATQSAAELLLGSFPQVRHVFLASGSCLPLRPLSDLAAFLEARPDTDLVESVAIEDIAWTKGGLDIERFNRHFPFSWRRHRWLFDRHVALQRRLKLTRRIPEGLVPHLGSQWWCLTRQTLQAILSDPRRAEFDRYFRRTWIPDEGYFQTLARRHARRIESRSLTLAKFDHQGKPHLFYDDHLPLLRDSGCFVARKIWSGADGLYRAFLTPDTPARPDAVPDPALIDRLFSRATDQRANGRPGLWMQSRYPNPGCENGMTAAPYSVFIGFADLFQDFEAWLARAPGTHVHGRIFAWDKVHFAGELSHGPGAISAVSALRDYNPQSFLSNLIWNTRAERQCFQYCHDDRQDIPPFMAADSNARLSIIAGAWVLPLFRSGRPAAELRQTAAAWQRTEAWHMGLFRSRNTRAQVRIWSLAECVEAPLDPLQAILDEVSPRSPHRLAEAPRMIDVAGLGAFIQDLRNLGVPPVLAGDFPQNTPVPAPDSAANRTRMAG